MAATDGGARLTQPPDGMPRRYGARVRFLRVAALDFNFHLRRPLLIILLLVLCVTSWGLTTGHVHISTGDQSVGGKRAFITSEHANALTLCVLVLLYYTFFVAVTSGTSIPATKSSRSARSCTRQGYARASTCGGKCAAGIAGRTVVIASEVRCRCRE